ncbi:hypothetical protein SB776_33725, partial [Burkholderia sp. SIMBA_045]
YLGVHKPQRLDLAEPYYLKIYEYRKTQPEVFEMMDMEILNGVGRFYLEKGVYKKTITLASEVLQREKLKKNPAHRLFAYQLLADSNEELKNSKEQAKYTLLYAKLNDSLNEAAKRQVSHQFDTLIAKTKEKKDKEYSSR